MRERFLERGSAPPPVKADTFRREPAWAQLQSNWESPLEMIGASVSAVKTVRVESGKTWAQTFWRQKAQPLNKATLEAPPIDGSIADADRRAASVETRQFGTSEATLGHAPTGASRPGEPKSSE